MTMQWELMTASDESSKRDGGRSGCRAAVPCGFPGDDAMQLIPRAVSELCASDWPDWTSTEALHPCCKLLRYCSS
jgi:hypothetical protein